MIIEAVSKLQVFERQLMKTAVLEPLGRKTARAGIKCLVLEPAQS
jgi:hypothetical protein